MSGTGEKAVEMEWSTIGDIIKIINAVQGLALTEIPDWFPLTYGEGWIYDAWSYYPYVNCKGGVWEGRHVVGDGEPRKHIEQFLSEYIPSLTEFQNWSEERKARYMCTKVSTGDEMKTFKEEVHNRNEAECSDHTVREDAKNFINMSNWTAPAKVCSPPLIEVPSPICTCGGHMVHIRTGEQTEYRKAFWRCNASVAAAGKLAFEGVPCCTRISVDKLHVGGNPNEKIKVDMDMVKSASHKYNGVPYEGPICNICGMQMRSYISRGMSEHYGRPYWFCGGSEVACHSGEFIWVDECKVGFLVEE